MVMRRFVPVGLAALAVLLAGSVFFRIYADPRLLLWLAVAVVAAVALALAAYTIRAAFVVSLLMSLVGFLVLGGIMSLLVPSMEGDAFPWAYLSALRNTGAELLTATIPVQPTPGTLLLPMATAWLGAAIAAETLLRTGRALAALIGPLLTLIVALVVVGPNATGSSLLVLALLVVCAFVLALTRAEQARRPAAATGESGTQAVRDAVLSGEIETPPAPTASRLRRVLSGLVGLAVLAASVIVLGPVLAQQVAQPGDPRTYVSPPEQQVAQTNPLGRLAGWAQRPTEVLLQVRTSDPARIRWVTLDHYDGLTWTPGSNYRSAGSVLPKLVEPGAKTSPIQQTIRIVSLYGAWLPAVEQPRQITGAQVSVDTSTGSLVRPQGLAPGLTYGVTSDQLVVSPPELNRASTPTTGDLAATTEVPTGVPSQLVDLAHRITNRAGSPYQRALLLERYLRDSYEFNPEAPSGHGITTLRFFLTTPKAKGGGRGTSEQFAASYVLLARLLGLPTRIVVGFHAGSKASNGEWQVRAGDAFAWPEVYFSGFGWVPFDPTAPDKSSPTPPEAQTPQAKKQQEVKQQQYQQLQTPNNQKPPNPDTPPDAPTFFERYLPLLIAGAILVLLLCFPAAFAVVRVMRRRRRLNRGIPVDRVIGAWAEVLDLVRQEGRPAPGNLSASEVAAHAAEVVTRRRKPAADPDGAPTVQPVADLVNLVGFVSSVADLVGRADADQAASCVREFRAYAAKQRGWFRSCWFAIDARPLFWRSPRLPLASRPPAPPRPPKRSRLAAVGRTPKD